MANSKIQIKVDMRNSDGTFRTAGEVLEELVAKAMGNVLSNMNVSGIAYTDPDNGNVDYIKFDDNSKLNVSNRKMWRGDKL